MEPKSIEELLQELISAVQRLDSGPPTRPKNSRGEVKPPRRGYYDGVGAEDDDDIYEDDGEYDEEEDD